MPFDAVESNPLIDLQSPQAIAEALLHSHRQAFPDTTEKRAFIAFLCDQAGSLFAGGFPGFQAADTPYHDLVHTLQVALCLARLLVSAKFNSQWPIDAEAFEQAVTAAFLHDVGYFKKIGDNEGTGAKYTAHHEMRGAIMAYHYLSALQWPLERIAAVQRLILSTGHNRAIRAVPFKDDFEAFLGRALCSADLLAQMSDPRYLKRLPLLQKEVAESDAFVETPQSIACQHDLISLFKQTPIFWKETLQKHLLEDCQGVYKYLEAPFGSGTNAYIQAIDQHLKAISLWEQGGCKGLP